MEELCDQGHALAGDNLTIHNNKPTCRRCYNGMQLVYYYRHHAHRLAWRQQSILSLKLETFERYGGCACACCGETVLEFLTLDHVNNNGNEERRKLGGAKDWGGRDLYFKLRKAGWPPGYQVLCRNCNWGRHINGGTCPHEEIQHVATKSIPELADVH